MPEDYDPKLYITISNAVVMQKDLIPLFLDNAFGIDVDVRDMHFFSNPVLKQCYHKG